MHKLLEDPVPAPATPVTATGCKCVCTSSVTDLNGEVVAGDLVTTSDAIKADMDDPPPDEG